MAFLWINFNGYADQWLRMSGTVFPPSEFQMLYSVLMFLICAHNDDQKSKTSNVICNSEGKNAIPDILHISWLRLMDSNSTIQRKITIGFLLSRFRR